VEVLKFPHHGSKYGALDAFLDTVKPELAVISVGKNPGDIRQGGAGSVLSKRQIEVKRTRSGRDIEVLRTERAGKLYSIFLSSVT